MGQYMWLVTRWTPPEIQAMLQQVQSGSLHPRDAKMKLAREITSIFYGETEAARAEDGFVQLFRRKETPESMDEIGLVPGATVLDMLMRAGLASSKSAARRLLAQNGIRLDGELLQDGEAPFPGPGVLQAGKRRFVRIVKAE